MAEHVGPFERVVCGIDGTRESFEAARQASRLVTPGGRLLIVAVVEFYAALEGRWGPQRGHWRMSMTSERRLGDLTAELRRRAAESLAQVTEQLGTGVDVATSVVDGAPAERLRDAAAAEGAGLLAVGTHGGGRLSGLALGEPTTMLLRDPPTSILVARRPFDPGGFPARIVVGLDGSEPSRAALAVAARIGERSGGRVTVVAAEGDDHADAAEIGRMAGPHELVRTTGSAVDALVDAAQTADLLVVGSRGLRGAKALGSVSERVAHRASSSVLVVT